MAAGAVQAKPSQEKAAVTQNLGKEELHNQEDHRGDVRDNEDTRWQPVLALPCQMAVDLPLPNFKVGDFLKLQAGSVIATAWRITRDVPLRINGTLIGWGEFDGSGKYLAVRLTELA
jgi:flagellar motor switch/type III secretory pathway protein FliN